MQEREEREMRRLRTPVTGKYTDMEEKTNTKRTTGITFFVSKLSDDGKGYLWPQLEVAEEPEAGENGLRVKTFIPRGTGLPIVGHPALADCGASHAWTYTAYGDVFPTNQTICGRPHHECYNDIPVWGTAPWAMVNESATPNCFICGNCLWVMDDLEPGTFLSVNYMISTKERAERGYELCVDSDDEQLQRRDDELKKFLDTHKEKVFKKNMRVGNIEAMMTWLANKLQVVLNLKTKMEEVKSCVHQYDLPACKFLPTDFQAWDNSMSSASTMTCMFSEACKRVDRPTTEPHYVAKVTPFHKLCWGCHTKLLNAKKAPLTTSKGHLSLPALPPGTDQPMFDQTGASLGACDLEAARTLTGAMTSTRNALTGPESNIPDAPQVTYCKSAFARPKHVSFKDPLTDVELHANVERLQQEKRDLEMAKTLQDEESKAQAHCADGVGTARKVVKYVPGKLLMELGKNTVYSHVQFKNDTRGCQRGDTTEYGTIQAVISIARQDRGHTRTDFAAIVSLRHRPHKVFTDGEPIVMLLEWIKDRMCDVPSKYATDEECVAATLTWCNTHAEYLKARNVINRPRWMPADGEIWNASLPYISKRAAATPAKAKDEDAIAADDTEGETLLQTMLCGKDARLWAFTVDCENLDDKLPKAHDKEGTQDDFESRMHKCCNVGDAFLLLSPALIPGMYSKRYKSSHVYIVGVIDGVYMDNRAGVKSNRKWVHTWRTTCFWLTGKDAVPLGESLGGMQDSRWVSVDRQPPKSSPWFKVFANIIQQIHESKVLVSTEEPASKASGTSKKAASTNKATKATKTTKAHKKGPVAVEEDTESDEFEPSAPPKKKHKKDKSKKKASVISSSESDDSDNAMPAPKPDAEKDTLKRELETLKATMAMNEAVEKAKKDLEEKLTRQFNERHEKVLKQAEAAQKARDDLEAENCKRAREEAQKEKNFSSTLLLSASGIYGQTYQKH